MSCLAWSSLKLYCPWKPHCWQITLFILRGFLRSDAISVFDVERWRPRWYFHRGKTIWPWLGYFLSFYYEVLDNSRLIIVRILYLCETPASNLKEIYWKNMERQLHLNELLRPNKLVISSRWTYFLVKALENSEQQCRKQKINASVSPRRSNNNLKINKLIETNISENSRTPN